MAQVGLRWQVGEIVFLLSRHPVFADEPSLVAGQMLSSIGSWRACKWRTGRSSLPSSRAALTEAARVSVTGCCRSLRQVVGGRFEATWNDSEIFSLDKTIEARRPESF